MTIGEKIKQLRTSQKLTQKELSEQLNVSSQAISNWERGQAYPDISNIIQLSDLFDISLDVLIKEDSDFKDVLLEKKIERFADMIFSAFTFIFVLACFLMYSYKLFIIKSENNYTAFIIGLLVVTHYGSTLYKQLRMK